MVTIGIETSCDETAVAVVEDGKVLSSEVSSSVHLHSRYGGVVPEIASRYHVEYIFPVFKKALKNAGKGIKEVNLIAVTREPGLPGSLLVGTAFAKAVSFAAGVPLIGVNHLYAHVLSCFIDSKKNCEIAGVFPFIGAVVSGGHTNIYWCESLDRFSLIGRTRDDAVGEAFDKVAKILELGYPGGPVVEKRASRFFGKKAIPFPRALLADKTDLDFSFSGIKTRVMYYWRDSSKTEGEKNKICFSFQEAAVDVIEKKIFRAIKMKKASVLAVGGGVVNNKSLRQKLVNRS
ncbi:MAG: tRNA (adenosine(37)-N6)-threonylcarbamoyltransferase complex transferase subunit TsaD, partial [Candidatus Omnitrophica bacterium]|nr:tRNA (adenosine(37)-N6)-threonylcarbamoyltransferase complex transferase subunit TsaD [Candidatus Omnitrophota bacterium]MBU1895187.1 tRNA (adenosine(37)-N6)-threonylcarbamoyltransferase complex transferase subunit TsaD [Candidatus Omnitrophota bacterium]